jgi:pyruvate kinase
MLGAEIEAVKPWGVLARVTLAEENGVRLKSGKALTFPNTELDIPVLSESDCEVLRFVADHADGIELSFVQLAEDVRKLQEALGKFRLMIGGKRPWCRRSRPPAVSPICLTSWFKQPDAKPTAIMIACSDLSVEIGFARTAEIQEELLWPAEANSVPAIWATQVLEKLVKTGTPTRSDDRWGHGRAGRMRDAQQRPTSPASGRSAAVAFRPDGGSSPQEVLQASPRHS